MNLLKFSRDNYKIAAKNATEFIKECDRVTQDREGVSFHDWQQQDRKADPVPYAHWNDAVIMGKSRVESDKSILNDSKHKDHEKKLIDYGTNFNSDWRNAERQYTYEARELLGAKKLELKNSAYELELFKFFQPFTAEDGAFLSKMKDGYNAKVAAFGYSDKNGRENDVDYIKAFVADHPFSPLFMQHIERNPNSIFYKP